jgi:ABC-2 type transport system permease protein
MSAFVWVHPVVLAILWAASIIFCTRYPAAEIDRGTIDVLLGLPVSRRGVYLCETAGWLSAGLVILAFGAIGYLIGSRAMELEQRPALALVALVMVNLYGVYLAVGGLTCLVSSLSDRRGRAVAVIFAVVLASFLLNFLAQFWDPAKHLVFLSVLDYYQPAAILRDGAIAPADLIMLFAIGLTGWAAGLEITARRSICTT